VQCPDVSLPINNAGVLKHSPFINALSLEAARAKMETNYRSTRGGPGSACQGMAVTFCTAYCARCHNHTLPMRLAAARRQPGAPATRCPRSAWPLPR
jgi:hypothetical protein